MEGVYINSQCKLQAFKLHDFFSFTRMQKVIPSNILMLCICLLQNTGQFYLIQRAVTFLKPR